MLWFVLGTLHGSHDWTYGLILDKLVQMKDPKQRPVSKIFEEEIAKPLGNIYFFLINRYRFLS